MHKVASCFVGRSNSVRKTRPFARMGDDSPEPTAVFQRTFWLGPNSAGGLPSPIPEEFGPRNCGHSAALAMLDKTTVANAMIQEVRVMTITSGAMSRHDCTRLTTSGKIYSRLVQTSVRGLIRATALRPPPEGGRMWAS